MISFERKQELLSNLRKAAGRLPFVKHETCQDVIKTCQDFSLCSEKRENLLCNNFYWLSCKAVS